MTPDERQSLADAAGALMDLLASYGDEEAIRTRTLIDSRTLTESETVRLTARALRLSVVELVSMTRALRAAVEIGNNHAAAFTAVQAEAATQRRVARASVLSKRVRWLRAKGHSVPEIAALVDRTERRVRQILKDPPRQ